MISCEFTGDRVAKHGNWTCIGKKGTLKRQLIYLSEKFCYYLLQTTQFQLNVVGVSLSHPTFDDHHLPKLVI